MHNRLKNQKSITEFWTKIPTLKVEGLGPGLGGELDTCRDGLQPPDLPLKVQIRVERSKERKAPKTKPGKSDSELLQT